jgi:hypothetical protein
MQRFITKLTWKQIREAYDGEWVELTECSWGASNLQPDAARVRFHHVNRAQLMIMINRAARCSDSVVLFVGPAVPAISMHDGKSAFSVSLA